MELSSSGSTSLPPTWFQTRRWPSPLLTRARPLFPIGMVTKSACHWVSFKSHWWQANKKLANSNKTCCLQNLFGGSRNKKQRFFLSRNKRCSFADEPFFGQDCLTIVKRKLTTGTPNPRAQGPGPKASAQGCAQFRLWYRAALAPRPLGLAL